MYRIAHLDWWEQEMPSEEEQTKGIDCLEKWKWGDRLCHHPLLSRPFQVLCKLKN